MSTSIFPKYQPIIFEEYLPRECLAKQYVYQSIAAHGDVATFQVIVEPCEGTTNVIVNPTFDPSESVDPNWEWTTDGGIVQPGEGFCKDNDGSAASISKDDLFVIGTAYKLDIVVTSLVGKIQVYNGASLLDEIAFIGTNTINFVATAQDIRLDFENPQNYGCVASVNAYPFSPNMAFGIIDDQGNTAAVADYLTNPEYFTFAKNTVTVTFNWSDFNLADECYTIGFANGCTNTNAQFGIFNQTFDSGSAGWDSVVGTLDSIDFLVDDGEPIVKVNATGSNKVGSISSNTTELKDGLCYTITVNDASSDADGFIRFYCGTNFHDLDLTVGIYPTSFNITCAGNTTFTIEFHTETATNIELPGFELSLCNQEDYEFDYESQSFKLSNSQDCTHILSFTNNEDGMGFVFEDSGFEPQVRLKSEIYDSVAETLREFYHSNTGNKQVYYGEYRKHFNFVTCEIPAWLIDFFHVAFIADNFFVDGNPYFIEGEALQPEWTEGVTNLGVLRFEISEKEQLTRNANINVPECGNQTLSTIICADLNNVDFGLTLEQRENIFLMLSVKTGQTTSYEAGDDGELQYGRGNTFLTLPCVNWFGNTNRFTDINGVQSYPDDLVIDWQTRLMWWRLPIGTVADWDTAVTNAAATSVAGYDDWFLPNINQLESLRNIGVSDTFGYSPINIMSTPYANLWSSSTNPNATTEAYRINPVNGNVNGQAKSTAGIYYIICRYFTKADLGL